ncbi:MAG: enoyl-CoA hydratase/isomerase family protein [Elusimicrobia bacterium]|nr:enoyl-CoA hydratase/isomerase family protein [Elusimicrobiota bacterium]
MAYERLKVEVGAVSVVGLSRPEVRNALDALAFREIADCFHRLSEDERVRVVVLRAEGKDFCAGADISWMREAGLLQGEAARKDASLVAGMCLAVAGCRAPVVARVHGSVFGGGLGLLAACDIVVAEASSRMCFSECRLGVAPAVISPFVLPKIGASFALRYYLTSKPFGMDEAVRMGLVHEAVPVAELDARVDAVVADILRNGPGAVAEAKALIRKLASPDLDGQVSRCLDVLVRVRSTAEAQEGLKAFLDGRPASYAASGAQPKG